MLNRPPRVFISYSHDSAEHRERVRVLADRLRADGVDAWLDQYEPAPDEGWGRWVQTQVQEADFFLRVCSAGYRKIFKKAGWLDLSLTRAIRRLRNLLKKPIVIRTVLVVLSAEDSAHIPDFFQDLAWYDVSNAEGYEALYRRLTEQPEILRPPVGEFRKERGASALRAQVDAPRWVGLSESAHSPLISFSMSTFWASDLLERLRQGGATVQGCRSAPSEVEEEPNRWLLRIRVQPEIRDLYAIAPEILVLVVPDEAHGRDLLRARQELYRSSLDLDPDLLVVVDDKDDLAQRLDYIAPSRGQWIPWSRVGGGFPALADQLKTYLPAHDIFEHKDPVRGRQVIGRSKTTADITRRLRQGQAVGIFGLRKVGKTSVVRAATDHLDPVSAHLYLSPAALQDQERGQTEVLVAWLDCQLVHERSLEALAQRLGRELERRLELEGFKLPARDSGQSFLVHLAAVVEEALSRSSLTICIVLDEYDLLFETATGEAGVEGVEKLFGLFRGYAQQTGRLALVAIGRDPVFLNRPKMGGWPNPMLQWLTPYWLGPLEAGDADELLERLGRRVCLDVGERSKRLAYQWTGGHPLLHRQFGSALLELARTYEHDSDRVATDPFCEAALDVFLSRDTVMTISHEVSDLLLQRYPGAADRLHELSFASPQEVSRLIENRGGWHRADLRILRNFGLLLGSAAEPWIPEVFRWFARTIESYNRRITA